MFSRIPFVYFPVRVGCRRGAEGDLESRHEAAAFLHTWWLTWSESAAAGNFSAFPSMLFSCFNSWARPVFSFVTKGTSFFRMHTSPRSEAVRPYTVSVCSWDCSWHLGVPAGSSSPHFTFVFPSLFLILWMSSSSIRSEDSRLTKTGYWAPTIE